MVKLSVEFYEGERTVHDTLIRLCTLSRVTHVQLRITTPEGSSVYFQSYSVGKWYPARVIDCTYDNTQLLCSITVPVVTKDYDWTIVTRSRTSSIPLCMLWYYSGYPSHVVNCVANCLFLLRKGCPYLFSKYDKPIRSPQQLLSHILRRLPTAQVEVGPAGRRVLEGG